MGRAEKILSKRRSTGGLILIFVTVGTHEQGMERLFEELDRLIESKEINQEVFAQIGYSKYLPRNYKYKKMLGYYEMDEYVKKADVVITHGGPGSIFHPLQYGKIPIVVPRNPEFNEHVDDHQILFTKRLEENLKVIAIYNIKDLKNRILEYCRYSRICIIEGVNNNLFIKKFDRIVNEKLRL